MKKSHGLVLPKIWPCQNQACHVKLTKQSVRYLLHFIYSFVCSISLISFSDVFFLLFFITKLCSVWLLGLKLLTISMSFYFSIPLVTSSYQIVFSFTFFFTLISFFLFRIHLSIIIFLSSHVIRQERLYFAYSVRSANCHLNDAKIKINLTFLSDMFTKMIWKSLKMI